MYWYYDDRSKFVEIVVIIVKRKLEGRVGQSSQSSRNSFLLFYQSPTSEMSPKIKKRKKENAQKFKKHFEYSISSPRDWHLHCHQFPIEHVYTYSFFILLHSQLFFFSNFFLKLFMSLCQSWLCLIKDKKRKHIKVEEST